MLGIIDAPIWIFLLVVFGGIFILPIWFSWVALNRAGLAGPLALLWLIPFGGVLALGILAFSRWPAMQPRR